MSNPQPSLSDAIIDLYQSVKIRKETEAQEIDSDFLEEEKKSLKRLPSITLISYIKSHIEILIKMKVSEMINQMNIDPLSFISSYGSETSQDEYEKQLRKYESTIRTYIAHQNYLRLQIDEQKYRNELLERTINELKSNKTKESVESNIVEGYKKEIEQLKTLVQTYEKHNLRIPLLEKKLKMQKIELNELDSYYKEKIRSYSKKIEKYEREVSLTKQNYSSRQNNNANLNNLSTLNINSPTFATMTQRTINHSNNYDSIDDENEKTIDIANQKTCSSSRKKKKISFGSASSKKTIPFAKKMYPSKGKLSKHNTSIKKIPKNTTMFTLKDTIKPNCLKIKKKLRTNSNTSHTSLPKDKSINQINNISNIQNIPYVNNINIYTNNGTEHTASNANLNKTICENSGGSKIKQLVLSKINSLTNTVVQQKRSKSKMGSLIN